MACAVEVGWLVRLGALLTSSGLFWDLRWVLFNFYGLSVDDLEILGFCCWFRF